MTALISGGQSHLGGGKASAGILLGHEPVDNAFSVAQINHRERLYRENR